MPFTSTAADIELVQNPKTGRYDLSLDGFGNPVYSDTRTHAVLSLLIEHRGEWAADPTGERGSVLHRINQDRSRTASEIENASRDCLTPLIRRKAIQANPTAIATRTGPGAYRETLIYQLPNGQPVTVKV